MAPCCSNTVTPKMIRKGEIKIGDRIQLDEILASADLPSLQEEEPVPASSASVPSEPEAVPVQNQMQATPMDVYQYQVRQQAAMNQQQMMPQQQNWQQPQEQTMQQNWQQPPQQMMPGMQMQPQMMHPITYEQMTPYMNQVQMSPSGNQPAFAVPQTPMTTQNFQETIDSEDVQSYLGFMRTQIGRFVRLEQLMGSNNVELRLGFLVGLGTNYVILQEITSGNLLVVDLFTIRMTYIYYSSPVFPPNIQQ